MTIRVAGGMVLEVVKPNHGTTTPNQKPPDTHDNCGE